MVVRKLHYGSPDEPLTPESAMKVIEGLKAEGFCEAFFNACYPNGAPKEVITASLRRELNYLFEHPAFKDWHPKQVISTNLYRNTWLSKGLSNDDINEVVSSVLKDHDTDYAWSTTKEMATYDEIESAIKPYELYPVGDGITWKIFSANGDQLISYRVLLSNKKYKFQVKESI